MEVHEEPKPGQGGKISPGVSISVSSTADCLFTVTFSPLNACAVVGAETRPGFTELSPAEPDPWNISADKDPVWRVWVRVQEAGACSSEPSRCQGTSKTPSVCLGAGQGRAERDWQGVGSDGRTELQCSKAQALFLSQPDPSA